MTEGPKKQSAKPFPSTVAVTALLFWSGFCALVYQVAWQREFRMVFGASTAASAAVLAIFMAGLGGGSLLLGRLADRRSVPLALYARLEAGIAALSAASPFLLRLGRHIYVAFGGMERLGPVWGTLARLLVASLVVLPATFMMGGTLPAASRAVENDDDTGRRRLALVYGVNTLGAVVGGAAATFFLLEILGTRNTIWFASLINALVAVVAQKFARETRPGVVTVPVATPAESPPPPSYLAGPLIASATVGFAFFLMELVWYRMLAPLLGGTIFAFGTILVAALVGIGVGGLVYSFVVAPRIRSASIYGFSILCSLEALFLLIPYALGDRIAILVLMLKSFNLFGFAGHLARWSIVCLIAVIPAAVVSGIQFPWLVAMMGQGRKQIGKQVGAAYALNTVGAVVGALAGGFGLLPWLSAQGAWLFGGVCLAILGGASALISLRIERRPMVAGLALGLCAICAVLMTSRGPTSVWRDTQIGVGRETMPQSKNDLLSFENGHRAAIVWSRDGVESNVALGDKNGYSFIVNGKSDGNVYYDADTQVMGGILGAILRPHGTRALVIGLGTGSTAGWLAAVPNITRVDVDELEPAVLDVAKACKAVNHGAMDNPKVHIHLGDARELILTSKETYDIIFSEPSNPFRAGVASLFSKDFYDSVSNVLSEDGVFLQWIQGYEVDSQTVQSIYATLSAGFPQVETWQTSRDDLLLVGFKKPHPYAIAELDARTAEEPIRSALRDAWHVQSPEGLFAHFVARPGLARYVAQQWQSFVSTDDQNFIEYGFAQSMSGVQYGFHISQVRSLAEKRGEERPEVTENRPVDWQAVELNRWLLSFHAGNPPPPAPASLGRAGTARVEAYRNFLRGESAAAVQAFRSQNLPSLNVVDDVLIAEGLANLGDPSVLPFLEQHLADRTVEADAIRAAYLNRQNQPAQAAQALERAFVGYRTDPWPIVEVMQRGLRLGRQIARGSPSELPGIVQALSEPFAAHILEEERRTLLVSLADQVGGNACVGAWHALEPSVPWTLEYLKERRACYAANNDPLLARAETDLERFIRNAPSSFLGSEINVQPGVTAN
jgi:spermidine synthase